MNKNSAPENKLGKMTTMKIHAKPQGTKRSREPELRQQTAPLRKQISIDEMNKQASKLAGEIETNCLILKLYSRKWEEKINGRTLVHSK